MNNTLEALQLRVWAPAAGSVAVSVANETHPMRKADRNGYWEATLDVSSSDGRYAFNVDGRGPFPDPRSHRQPDGVHGPSMVVDHDDFRWSDERFRARPLSSAVIYELHTGTFTQAGTFDAAIEKLDHLRELGVTHVEVMPIAASSGGRGWGYDGVGLFAPWEAYGGPNGFKRFVDACHRSDIAVILDVVYNHLGPEGNYLGVFGPYFTDAYRTPWGDAVNLDGPNSDEVRAFILDNAEHWLRRYHVDGLRLDAVHALFDASAMHILEQLSRRTDSLSAELGKPLVLIAESDLNDPKLVAAHDASGYGLSAQWSDDFHHAVHALVTGEADGYYDGFGGMAQLAKAFRKIFVRDGHYAPHRNRSYGRPAGETARSRFVHCIQNHDQVGNRAVGERISHLVSTGRSKIAAALNLLSPAVPMLFQGEEWAASTPFQYFTDHQDAELGVAVSAGRRAEFAAFGWDEGDIPDPQDSATRENSILNWDEMLSGFHAEMLEWYRALTQLRARSPELSCAAETVPKVVYDGEKSWMMVFRGPYCIAFTLSNEGVELLPAAERERIEDGRALFGHAIEDPGGGRRLLLASDPRVAYHRGELTLPADSVAVLLW